MVTTSEVARPVVYGGAVDHQHPVLGDVHLVARSRVVGAQELRQIRPVDRAGRQREQPAGLVIDQRHAVAVQHDQPLRHRMQDRVVVLVHHPQLVGAQPVGLAQQPSPDRPHPDQRDGQRRNADRGDRRPLRAPALGQGLLRDARRHQADDPAGAVAHRHDGADRRAERAGVDLGERLAAQRGLDGAEVLPADLRADRCG